MFSISCFEGSTCLANVVIGTVVTFKFVNTCGCVFFVYGVVCEVPFEGVVCGVCYVVFQFSKSQTRDSQLRVPPGGLVIRIFTS